VPTTITTAIPSAIVRALDCCCGEAVTEGVSGVGRLREAIEKTKSPMDVSWLALTEGGEFGTWIAAIGHDSSADFGSPTPDEILKNAFGKDEATAIVNEVSALIGGHFTEEVVQFRPDLSYFPKK
jgi:hypothetical protein